MEYAVLLYDDEAKWASATEEEMAEVFAAHARFAEAVSAGGGREVEGVELQLSDSARSLRWTGGPAPDAVDGPFAETTEQLGGLYVIEAPDLDHVLQWCRLLPHTTEIRPTVSYDDPAEGADATAGAGPGSDEGSSTPPGQLQALALMYGDEEVWAQADEQQQQEVYAQHEQFSQAVVEAGCAVLGGRELAHSDNATTLRRGAAGDWTVTDGPFAEVVEQLGGYYHLAGPDAATLEKLLHLLPGGVTEIRPVALG